MKTRRFGIPAHLRAAGFLLVLVAACSSGSSSSSEAPPILVGATPPSSSSLGTVPVSLFGVGFDTVDAGLPVVTFGGIPATGVTVQHNTTLSCTPPVGLPGSVVDIVVTNNHGSSILTSAFRYHAQPTTGTVAPTSGTSLCGATTTITGTGFEIDFPGVPDVLFDGVPATGVTVVDDFTLTCDTPPGAPGATVDVVVTNLNGTDTITGAFRNHLVPTLSGCLPNRGGASGGLQVTVTGTGFLVDAAGPNTVLFGGQAATNIVVLDDSTITCDIPTGTPGATVDVELSNANGSAIAVGDFTFNPLPVLAAVSPASGNSAGGDALTLTGSGFQNFAPGLTTVTLGGQPATGVVVVDDSTLTCTTPPGVLGSTVDVAVMNANGVATLIGGFLYTTEPSITSITPSSGPQSGGTSVTLDGAGFVNFGAGTNVVTIDGQPVAAQVVVDDTTLTCDVPASLTGSGAKDVVLTNANGSFTLTGGFRYHALPVLSAVTPGVGPAGGRSVTLTGSGFQSDAPGTNVVTFGGIAASSVVVVDDTTLTCIAPAGAAGSSVDVVVTNANGAATLSNGFRYASPPTLSGVAPGSGTALGGTSVTLTGSGYQVDSPGVTTVTFGGTAATSVVVSDDATLTCSAPVGTPGSTVDVVLANANGSATLLGAYTFHPTPTLTSVAPTTGTSAGGETVTLTGSGFQNNAPGPLTVDIGGSAASSIVVLSDTMLTCVTPSGAGGSSVDVSITTANGSAVLTGAFTYNDAPTLIAVLPTSGSSLGGTTIALAGSGFQNNSPGTNVVTLDGNAATSVVVVNDSTLNCVTPAGVDGTSVDVVITNDNGSDSLSAAFAYHPRPTLTQVLASSGTSLGGTAVTLTGTGFTANAPGAHAVTFDGNPATSVVVVNDTTITCDTPAGAAGTSVDVVVTNGNGAATLVAGFRYHATPTLTLAAPGFGPTAGGTSVTLTGSGFQSDAPGTNTVTFDGNPATSVVVVDDTTLTCDTPAGSSGSVDVVLGNANGQVALVGGFSYNGPPALSSIAPATGTSLGGTSVTLTGSGFQSGSPGVNTVTFDGTPATSVVVVNDTTLTCDTPAGTAGASVDVVVTNANGAATLTSGFAYRALPTLTLAAPATGTPLGGTSVTLTGSGFQSGSPGVNTVTFGGAPATSLVVVDDTTLTCDTPAGSGAVDVVVSNANGVATLTSGYTYNGAPTLTGVAPGSGPSTGSTSLTLTGSGFQNGAPGTNTVTVDGNPATSVVVVNDSTITCDTPAGTAGSSVDVVVTNANGIATLTSGFAYNALPTLTAAAPTSGSSLGGTSVTLTGSGFQSGSPGTNVVTFDGNAATSVVVVDDSTITCSAPVGMEGTTVDVVVANDNGIATLTSGFAFHPLPSVAIVFASSGSSLGGTNVTVAGSGFQNGSPGTNTVTFDGNPATSVVVVDDNTLTCTTPAGSAGTAVEVGVSNANGSGTLNGGFTYHPTPVLSMVSPAGGPSAGGTSLTLTGSGFLVNGAGTNTVTVDGNGATSVIVVNDTTITCDTPSGSAGVVDVAVTNVNGTGTSSGAFQYYGAPNTSLSTVVVDPSFGTLANGTDTALITVTVRDSSGSGIPGVAVTPSVSGTGNVLTPSSGTSDASGVFTATLSSTHAEFKTVTTSVNGGAGSVNLNARPVAEFVWTLPNAWFVRTTGNDTNSGTGPTNAFATIGRAALAVSAGDTIYVGGGTYAESVSFTTNGTLADPIRLVGDVCGDVTGDAGTVLVDAMGANHALRITGDFVEVRDVTLTGGSSIGLFVDGAGDFKAIGVSCYGNPYGYYMNNTTDAVLGLCRASNNSNVGLLSLTSTNLDLASCLVYNNSSVGVSTSGSTFSMRGCTVHFNGGAGIRATSSSTGTVTNTIVVNNSGSGLEAPAGSTITEDYNDVWNNSPNYTNVFVSLNSISADPLFEDPDGADDLLGGADGEDDSFYLVTSPPSPALDVGSAFAFDLPFVDGLHFGDLTTRLDNLLDHEDADGDTINLGFHYPGTQGDLDPLAEGEARLLHSSEYAPMDLAKRVQIHTYASGWTGNGQGLAADNIVIVQHAASPLDSDEELVGLLTDAQATELAVHRWTGMKWVEEFLVTTTVPQEVASFDIAYEPQSGDALVVYADGGNTPHYRTRTAGVWSAELTLPLNDGGGPNPDRNSAPVRWLELESRPLSDEIALAYCDDNEDLIAMVWDGTQWLTATATTVSTSLEPHSGGDVENRAFDLAYESFSGDLLVAWTDTGGNDLLASTKLAGSTSFGPTLAVEVGSIDPQFVDLSADPGSNRIAATGASLEGTEQLVAAIWTGTAWTNGTIADSMVIDANGAATGHFPCAAGWLSGDAYVVYADESAGAIHWQRWVSGSGWSAGADHLVAGMGLVDSVQLEKLSGQNTLIVALTDDNHDLWSATFDGSVWTVTNGGAPLELDTPTSQGRAFDLTVD